MTSPTPLTPANEPADGAGRYCLCSDPDYCLLGSAPELRSRAIDYRREHGAPLPSDAGSDPASLTDEELAELYRVFVVGPTTILDTVDYGTFARLIVALRASRAEVERLQSEVDDWRERWEAEGLMP